MSLRGVFVLPWHRPLGQVSRSSLPTLGDCFVGKNKNPPRNDIIYVPSTTTIFVFAY